MILICVVVLIVILCAMLGGFLSWVRLLGKMVNNYEIYIIIQPTATQHIFRPHSAALFCSTMPSVAQFVPRQELVRLFGIWLRVIAECLQLWLTTHVRGGSHQTCCQIKEGGGPRNPHVHLCCQHNIRLCTVILKDFLFNLLSIVGHSWIICGCGRQE